MARPVAPGTGRSGSVAEPQEATIQEALVIRPGDKLLVRVRQNSSLDHVERLLSDLKRRLPEVEVTVVAAEQLAVVRDG
jgi:hypothetical protein